MRYFIAFALILSAVSIPSAKASLCAKDSITESKAIRILIGEASGEGEKGMQAVGEVLRRRNSTRGFYGLRAKHVDKQPAWVWSMARRAWMKSAASNITKGATLFENIVDFKKPYWYNSSEVTVTVGRHTFLKQRKGNKNGAKKRSRL